MWYSYHKMQVAFRPTVFHIYQPICQIKKYFPPVIYRIIVDCILPWEHSECVPVSNMSRIFVTRFHVNSLHSSTSWMSHSRLDVWNSHYCQVKRRNQICVYIFLFSVYQQRGLVFYYLLVLFRMPLKRGIWN